MPECHQTPLEFPPVKRRRVEGDFSGGDITSNAGIGLLAQVDQHMGLIKAVTWALRDPRRQASCEHSLQDILQQRVYGLALGYEDLDDHGELRHDLALQTAASRIDSLASPATWCRLEQRSDRASALAIHQVLFRQFVASHKRPPRRLILDLNTTDIPLHGDQEGRFFHGYYDHYCYLPLYVFCGRHLLVSYLRSSKIDPAKHSWAILSLLVKALRRHWPQVEIIFRGDSGFCRWQLLRWCERHNVSYTWGWPRTRVYNAHHGSGGPWPRSCTAAPVRSSASFFCCGELRRAARKSLHPSKPGVPAGTPPKKHAYEIFRLEATSFHSDRIGHNKLSQRWTGRSVARSAPVSAFCPTCIAALVRTADPQTLASRTSPIHPTPHSRQNRCLFTCAQATQPGYF